VKLLLLPVVSDGCPLRLPLPVYHSWFMICKTRHETLDPSVRSAAAAPCAAQPHHSRDVFYLYRAGRNSTSLLTGGHGALSQVP